MAISVTQLTPILASPPPTILGQTVLAIGVVPGLQAPAVNTPYLVGSTISAANVFGNGRLTRAIGELFRQQAAAVLAIGVASPDDLPPLLDFLVDLPFDILLPVGISATSSNMALFGSFAYEREQFAHPILVVMPADTSYGGTSSALTAHLAASGAGQIDVPGVTYPLIFARYFVQTVDQLIINPNFPSQYVADAAPSVAGLLASLSPQTAVTNRALSGVSLVGNGYSPSDAQKLADSGYLTLRNSVRLGLVPILGVTATSNDATSPIYSQSYHSIVNLRVAQFTIASLQASTDTLIGQPSGPNIQGAVSKTLTSLKSQGVLLDYAYEVSLNQVAGTATVQLALTPPYETTSISVYAQLNLTRS